MKDRRDAQLDLLAEMLSEARATITMLKREIEARDRYGHWLAQRVVELETGNGTNRR